LRGRVDAGPRPATVKEGKITVSGSFSKRTALLVDEHPLWLSALEQILSRAGIEVIAKLTSSATAERCVVERRPDLLITGIRMAPGEPDGLALVRAVRQRIPDQKVIVLSMFADQAHVDAAFEAGVIAYVVKTAQPDDIVSAARQAFNHSIFLAGARPSAVELAPGAPDAQYGLTPRELEILQLVGEGHSNAQVARKLWVTEQTVKFHLSNVYRKLDVSNRTEASRWAQLQGLLNQPSVQIAA
jgi:DNA-binding NarL/FixJ family response regulator